MIVLSARKSLDVKFPLASNEAEEPRVVLSFLVEEEAFNFDFDKLACFKVVVLGNWGFFSPGYFGGNKAILWPEEPCR